MQIKYTFAKIIDVYFMFSYNPELDVMSFAGKKLSRPGQYKDHSHNFFIR